MRFCCFLSLIGLQTVFSSPYTLNIQSDTLININNHEYISQYLLGLSAYAGVGDLNNATYLNQLYTNLGVNVVGFGAQLGGALLPKDQNEAVSCCNTTQGLIAWINSGNACKTFNQQNYDIKIQNMPQFYQHILPYVYLKDSCTNSQTIELNHCYGNDTGGGTPINDDNWWSYLVLGFVNCTLQNRPETKYFHLWNEPNAHFWKYHKNGTYYAEFYYNVTKLVKEYYPNILMGGPVTWCPPIWGTTFEDYYVSLFHRMKNNKQLLNYIDFHSYDNGVNNLSQWDYVMVNAEVISIYYSLFNDVSLKDGHSIKSEITETSVKLTDNQNMDNSFHWNLRTIENSKQILGLSFLVDKTETRHLFDLGADSYNFYDSVDYYAHILLKDILGKQLIYFNISSNDFNPRFYVNNIMFQCVYNNNDETINIIIINSNNEEEIIYLNDVAGKIETWNKDESQMAVYNGVYKIPSSNWITTPEFGVKLEPYSIYNIIGKYNNNNIKERKEYEYIQNNINDIMQIINTQSFNIKTSINMDAIYSYTIIEAYLKIGITQQITSFKWTLTINYKAKQYNILSNKEFNYQINSITLPNEIINDFTNSTLLNVELSGSTTQPINETYGSNRFAFVSLVIAYQY